MPTTRKKVIKTVYKDENDSEADDIGDFSDSGSEAQISEQSSEEDDGEDNVSSGEEFEEESKPSNIKSRKPAQKKKTQFAKSFINKIRNKPSETATEYVAPVFSVKDLTDADKLLPSVLNLSESDSSEDESPKQAITSVSTSNSIPPTQDPDSDDVSKMEYTDIWANNIPDNSEAIAQKTFMELEHHKLKIDETKASILNYTAKNTSERVSDVKDLLALGEEIQPKPMVNKKKNKRCKEQNDSDSEMEDWEEVKETKALPATGLQVVVDFPEGAPRKSKPVDVEMMMRRKINRVKKEYQVYMHKVHVLCWLGHGNYVSQVLNDQDIMAAVLTIVPSKECYPGERVDVKYLQQITKWYNNKITLKQDRNENKFKPKAPPLKETLLKVIKNKLASTKKYMFFIYVSMLRALGLQCRIMFNFVTLPIKPPSTELCSLSTKVKEEKKSSDSKVVATAECSKKKATCKKTTKGKISQVDGNEDSDSYIMQVDVNDISDSDIMQVDGNDDTNVKTRKTRSSKTTNVNVKDDPEGVSLPKRPRKRYSPQPAEDIKTKLNNVTSKSQSKKITHDSTVNESDSTVPVESGSSASASPKSLSLMKNQKVSNTHKKHTEAKNEKSASIKNVKSRQTRSTIKNTAIQNSQEQSSAGSKISQGIVPPEIIVTNENEKAVSSTYFDSNQTVKKRALSRKRSHTANPNTSQVSKEKTIISSAKTRSKSASTVEKSKYFEDSKKIEINAKSKKQMTPKEEDQLRVSHKDLTKKRGLSNTKIDVTGDLIDIIKTRVKEADTETKRKTIKGKIKNKYEGDSDYLPEEDISKRRNSASDDDFKPTKISPKPSTSRKIDRRVLSTDDEAPKDKMDVWCEVYVEELEQWIAVDVVKGKVHCTNEIYNRATHPVCYVVGWDNNNYLKDLTQRYVPHWNTVTRKLRAEPLWWQKALSPWRGPRTAKDKEEDEALNRMQLDAPLPKSIAEYKNHPLYALKRHLLKFEAIYPADAATLGFVRNEAVYARECVYVCRSRDTWLKEAKVVKLGEKPYKVVKARPKWDKLSNKLITDKPLEVFGPWQVQDYEPPVAENGIVPRNAYGNVELFKDCMLPKGTVHIKLPGLNKVAKKLNIDCAPAMTGFDFNGGWSHPVYDGFVVCKEFEEIITEAWLEDQEEQERKELKKTEDRVYGNWRRLIRGLMIRERLKLRYGFEEPSTSQESKKTKGPRLVVKKKN